MKKRYLFLFLLIPVFIIMFYAYRSIRHSESFGKERNLAEYKMTEFVPTMENKLGQDQNSIYCATMLFLWDEIRKKIGNDIQIDSMFHDLTIINNSKSYLNALDRNEYTVSTEIRENKIIGESDFCKSLSFKKKFIVDGNPLTFNKEKVASFTAWGGNPQIVILYYKDDDNFIIKILTKDKDHEIILFKTSKRFQTMSEILDDINANIRVGQLDRGKEKFKKLYSFNEEDVVTVPMLKFNIKTNYPTLENTKFQVAPDSFLINKISQKIAFNLDESGAKVKSSANIEVTALSNAPAVVVIPKMMIFDKPFFIMLKKVKAKFPYLGIWVSNPELMIKSGSSSR